MQYNMQDLKTLQVERRKLEGRAKTTVHFEKDLKDAGSLLKQVKIILTAHLWLIFCSYARFLY